MSGGLHKIVGHGGSCDYCGGGVDVVEYRIPETGDTYRVCDPCEQAAAAARGVQ